MLKTLLESIVRRSSSKPTPLGRWAVTGNWELRARLASLDSCCCSTHPHDKPQFIVVEDDIIIISSDTSPLYTHPYHEL